MAGCIFVGSENQCFRQIENGELKILLKLPPKPIHETINRRRRTGGISF